MRDHPQRQPARGEAICEAIVGRRLEEAEKICNAAHRAADSETKKAIEELRSQMADEIVQAVEATLKEKLDMKKHVKLIDNALKKGGAQLNGDIVAQRYAKALFALGQQEGMAKLEQYGENLSALEGVLEESPELVRLFHIPVISVAEKQKVLSQVLDKLGVDPMIKNFCSLLAEKERLPLFEEIAEAFGKLLDEAWGVVRGKLLTAVSLSKEQQAGILARLEKQTSRQIALKFEVDPSILGGVVLQVGDNVLDASLRAQLAILRDIIKRVNRIMHINAGEISKIIKEQIQNYEQRVDATETGTVLSVGDGIARVYGVQERHVHGASRIPRRAVGHGAQPGRRQRGCSPAW